MEYLDKKYSEKNDELDFRELIWIFKRYAVTIVIITILSLAGGIAYILLKQPIYSSSTTLLVQYGNENWWENLSPYGEQNKGKSELYIIKSRTIAENVVKDLHLTRRIIVPGREFDIVWFKKPGTVHSGELNFRVISNSGEFILKDPHSGWKLEGKLNTPITTSTGGIYIKTSFFKKGDSGKLIIYPFRKAVKKIMEHTSANYVESKTKVIRITVEDPDPIMASKIANKIAEKYIQWNVDARSEEATKSLNFINSQLKIIISQLHALENKYDELKREKRILSIDKELDAYVTQLSDLESNIYQIKFQRRAYQEILTSLKKSKIPSFYPIVSNDDVLSNLAQQLTDLKTKLSALLQQYTENSDQVQVVKSQIAQIYREMINYLRSRVEDLKIQEKQLEVTLQTLLNKLKSFPENEREILRLKRKLSVTEEIYKFLLEKKEETRITRAMTVSKIRIIDTAIPNFTPVSPRKKIIIILSFIFGLLFAFLLVIAYDRINDTIKSIDELKHIVNLPIFGIIPKIYPTAEAKGKKLDPYLIVHYNPRSQVAEAYRMLRTNIQFIDPTGKTKVFLVTSALPQEGKSITTANLAITLSKLGSKTLILDLDLHKPRQHEIFGKPLSPGITDYLTSHGRISLDEIIQPLEFENMFFIPAGTIPPNPSELISSPPFRDFLEKVKEKFDFIMIDSPPVTAVTDTLILSTIVDAVFLVVVEGSSGRENVKRAVELLRNVGGKLKGTIFNNVSPSEKSYKYYYYRGDYYYGREERPSLFKEIQGKIKEIKKKKRKRND